MVSDAYKAAMEKAKAQLIHAIKQHDFWNLEITRLQQLYKSLLDAQGPDLSAMEDALITGQVGFADLVQSIVSRIYRPRISDRSQGCCLGFRL